MVAQANYSRLEKFRCAERAGDLDTAFAVASQAAQAHEDRGDFKLAGMWLRLLTRCNSFQGNRDDAVITAKRSLLIQPDLYERGRSLLVLAERLGFIANFNAALDILGMAEDIANHFGEDVSLRALTHNTRAAIFFEMGDFDRAIIDYEQGATLEQSGGNVARAALAFNNLGFALAKTRRFREAESHLIRGLELAVKIPHVFAEADTCDSLGYVYTMLGRHADAEKLLARSIKLFEGLHNRRALADSLLNLSELRERMRQPAAARQDAARALELATEINAELLHRRAENRLAAIETLSPKSSNKPCQFHDLLYVSSRMRSVVLRCQAVAPTDEVVLLLGETGTGKDLLARAIHLESNRRHGPFIAFNCAAVSRNLIESRLFGHRRGAFTGADRHQPGVIRAAAGGTLLLDEIGELSLEAQGALLRFLQSREIQPVGESKPLKVDARVIAATNCDLGRQVEAGRFRKDLYYRLNVTPVCVPPLQDRREDVPALAQHFIAEYSRQYGRPEPTLSEEEKRWLTGHDWPGNVRELENAVKRRVLFGPGTLQETTGLPPGACARPALPVTGEKERGGRPGETDRRQWRRLSEAEKRRRLAEALARHDGNVTAAARQLGIDRRTIQLIRKKMRAEVA